MYEITFVERIGILKRNGLGTCKSNLEALVKEAKRGLSRAGSPDVTICPNPTGVSSFASNPRKKLRDG